MIDQLRGISAKKKTKRVGRGTGSGHGKTSCRGHKGAGQRKGRKHYIGFEGGNIPYLRKIPKRGFTPKRKNLFQVVTIPQLIKKMKEVTEITPQALKEKGLIKDSDKPVKIIGSWEGKEQIKFDIKVHKLSRKAQKVIESFGGKIECLKQ